MPSPTPEQPKPSPRSVSAQRLSRYVSRGRCERYLHNVLFPEEAKRLLKRYEVAAEPLSPLLAEAGHSFERERVEELGARAPVLDLFNRSAAAFVNELKAQRAGTRVFYYQPRLEGVIGGWRCEGYADLIRVDRRADDTVEAVVIDIKASRRETVGFRLQIAFYARLLEEALRQAGLSPLSVRGAVASRETELSPDGMETFDLALYTDEIERLVGAPDSDVARASQVTFETASFHLGPHCDGCPYNAVCFLDAAEREDLSLVPMLTRTEKRALQAEGVNTVRELAGFMRYARGAVEPEAGKEAEVERISSRWPLGSRLPVLAQRARAAAARHDRGVQVKPYIMGADWGSLPDEKQYPNLVKVFVDAQRDYLEDRLYLLSALVAGPSGSEVIIEMADAPPDEEAEKELLVRWVKRALQAIGRAADGQSAPLHVYLYDRRGQRSLLDALRRHFGALCAVPAFYDLLTSSPALSQGMISFLGDEVRERLNLSPVCQNLYEVAHAAGFKWREGDVMGLPRRFRARVFDSQRKFERDPETGKLRPAPKGSREGVWVEAASRFGTEIPLEYAYAAWGRLTETPEMEAKARRQIDGFVGVTQDHIRALTAQRLRALRFIEESFAHKNRRVEKQPLDLGRLDQVEVEPEDVPFSRSLEQFLLLEHHARLQELLLHLALPPNLRAQTGRSVTLRCDSYEKGEDNAESASFSFVGERGAALELDNVGALRLRAGDWVVLNPLADEEGVPPPAWRLIRGRLATIEELDGGRVSLRLLTMNFKNSAFRYPHRVFKPEAGTLYTLDEMADDLNADKFLEACRNAGSNHLYRWISDTQLGKSPRRIRPKRLREGRAVAELAHRLQSPRGLTEAQRRVIGEHFEDRVLTVQGPPGTGKSHTLGFAALARALALGTPARPFRVAVAARTHAATNIALASIARSAEALRTAGDDPRLAPSARPKVVKVCNGPDDSTADGVERVYADGSDDLTAAEQWEMLLSEPLLVVGGTPGGLYRLIKQGAARGRTLDWGQELFDLVIVDEASQMGIAEALTAAAFLRGDGQFIAIGDHRQMPPILAHAWDQESRRDLRRARPHLAIFDYLRALEFASAPLDQSFRVPAEIADFLQRHVYAGDGINFHSENRRRIDPAAGLEDWLAAVFAPEHPVVLLEHGETGSQQANEFEAAVVEKIVRAAQEHLGFDAREGVGIVVPHRAQRALLQGRLPEFAEAVDTVERFQGGERNLIVVSATVSDRDFALLESSFLLEPRRFTVAISRPRQKLIIISSRAIFDLIPADLDEYERGALWKYLRHECGNQTTWEGEIGGQHAAARVLGQPPRGVSPPNPGHDPAGG